MHEHQRPDADTFIELFHDNVNYFDQFDDIIDKLNDQWTLPIQGKLDSSTARWDWSICKSIEGIFMNDPDQNVPQLADLLPVRDSAIWPWKSEFVRDTQTLGQSPYALDGPQADQPHQALSIETLSCFMVAGRIKRTRTPLR